MNKFFVTLLLGLTLYQSSLPAKDTKDKDDDANSESTAFILYNSSPVHSVTKSFCAPDKKVEIRLPNKDEYTNYRVLVKRSPGQKGKPPSAPKCPGKIANNQKNIETFLDDDPRISSHFLLGESLCKKPESQGLGVLCIYPPEDADSNGLLAQAAYSYQLIDLKVKGFKNKVAINGHVLFTVETTKQLSNFSVETCYGKSDAGNITLDGCPPPFKISKSDSPHVKIAGLENNEEYALKARVILPQSDVSEWSYYFLATPVLVAFPMDTYDGEGGAIEYNCLSMPLDFSLFLAMLCCYFIFKRKTK